MTVSRTEEIRELAEIQDHKAKVLDHCVDGTIHAAASAVLFGIALLCEEIESRSRVPFVVEQREDAPGNGDRRPGEVAVQPRPSGATQ